MDSELAIKTIISNVNRTLKSYEKGYCSVKRTPETYQERCESFEEFIERRFNFEASKIPELNDVVMRTEGKLFCCTEIEEPDEKKRKFKSATIKINYNDLLLDEDEILKDEVTKIIEFLGGDRIQFNSVRKKIKLTIDNDDS
jgi:hypothetical protein